MKKNTHENDIETMLRAYGKTQVPSRDSFARMIHSLPKTETKKPIRSPFISFLGYTVPALLILVLIISTTHQKKKDVAIVIEAQKPAVVEPITADELENEMALNQQDSDFETALEQTLTDEEQALL